MVEVGGVGRCKWGDCRLKCSGMVEKNGVGRWVGQWVVGC